jgi:hypothetical protein
MTSAKIPQPQHKMIRESREFRKASMTSAKMSPAKTQNDQKNRLCKKSRKQDFAYFFPF